MKPGSLWVHQKTGNRYMIVALARMESTLEPVVVYSGEGRAWVRPEAEFRERFAELCSPFVGDKAEHRDQSDPRIHHIRHYREVNGSGLKEALDAVNGGYRAPEGWVPNPRRSHLPRQPNDT